jgi:hypothetical protein
MNRAAEISNQTVPTIPELKHFVGRKRSDDDTRPMSHGPLSAAGRDYMLTGPEGQCRRGDRMLRSKPMLVLLIDRLPRYL